MLSVCLSGGLLIYIVELVRRRKLREEYSILWLLGSLLILVLSVRQEWLVKFARFAGIAYSPSLLFLVGILFIMLILIHFSIAVSKLHQMNKRVAQQLSLLKLEIGAPDSDPGRSPRNAARSPD